jgi:hypothetical protein
VGYWLTVRRSGIGFNGLESCIPLNASNKELASNQKCSVDCYRGLLGCNAHLGILCSWHIAGFILMLMTGSAGSLDSKTTSPLTRANPISNAFDLDPNHRRAIEFCRFSCQVSWPRTGMKRKLQSARSRLACDVSRDGVRRGVKAASSLRTPIVLGASKGGADCSSWIMNIIINSIDSERGRYGLAFARHHPA